MLKQRDFSHKKNGFYGLPFKTIVLQGKVIKPTFINIQGGCGVYLPKDIYRQELRTLINCYNFDI